MPIHLPPYTGNAELDQWLTQMSQAFNSMEASSGLSTNFDNGEITDPQDNIRGYLYQYLDTAYASDQFGSDLTSTPAGLGQDATELWQGRRNSNDTDRSEVAAEFTWVEVDVGDNHPRDIIANYKVIGNRNIVWSFGTESLDGYSQDNADPSINLDDVTTTNTTVGLPPAPVSFAVVPIQISATTSQLCVEWDHGEATNADVFDYIVEWKETAPLDGSEGSYFTLQSFSSDVVRGTVTAPLEGIAISLRMRARSVINTFSAYTEEITIVPLLSQSTDIVINSSDNAFASTRNYDVDGSDITLDSDADITVTNGTWDSADSDITGDAGEDLSVEWVIDIPTADVDNNRHYYINATITDSEVFSQENGNVRYERSTGTPGSDIDYYKDGGTGDVPTDAYFQSTTVQLERWRSGATNGFLFNAAPLNVTAPTATHNRMVIAELDDIEDVNGTPLDGLAVVGTVFRIIDGSDKSAVAGPFTVSGTNSGNGFNWVTVDETVTNASFVGGDSSGDAENDDVAWQVQIDQEVDTDLFYGDDDDADATNNRTFNTRPVRTGTTSKFFWSDRVQQRLPVKETFTPTASGAQRFYIEIDGEPGQSPVISDLKLEAFSTEILETRSVTTVADGSNFNVDVTYNNTYETIPNVFATPEANTMVWITDRTTTGCTVNSAAAVDVNISIRGY